MSYKHVHSTKSQLLDEIAQKTCVICLDSVSEQAIALPCKHDDFDFLCLASWLQESASCPLCKASTTAVEYGHQHGFPKIYRVEGDSVASYNRIQPPTNSCLPTASSASSPWIQSLRANQRYPPRQFSRRRRYRSPPPSNDEILLRRKRIYELDLFSLHVGSNRLSGYSDLTPARFTDSPHLISRARKWIRRELQVFDFLAHPPNPNAHGSGSQRTPVVQAQRASSNAEFLLEYIIAILKTVDIKGSKGQAQEMLTEFLGARSALFLHELNAWLRSPFEELAVWDRNVRYEWPEGEQQSMKRTYQQRSTTDPDSLQGEIRKRRLERWIPD